jgi:putative DNA primase/helicase
MPPNQRTASTNQRTEDSTSIFCSFGGAYPPPNNPMTVARQLVGEQTLTLRWWRGNWMVWRETHWAETSADHIRSEVYACLETAWYFDGKEQPTPWLPDRSKVGNVMEALQAVTRLDERVDPPAWLGKPQSDGEAIVCTNGILDVRSRRLLPFTPEFFNLVSVPFAYDESAGAEPESWLKFINELYAGDPDTIKMKQEWFGYVVSGRTDMQKIFLMIGPKRSGKGTTRQVLTDLIGSDNVAPRSPRSMVENFGMESLIGKTLAVISDMRLRLTKHDMATFVERALNVSGEDPIQIARKNRPDWNGKLPARLMFFSNELPQYEDPSNALPSRHLVAMVETSWFGRENRNLINELRAELPAILNWALVGLERLDQQGRFTESARSHELVTVMGEVSSPEEAFVKDRCTTGPVDVITMDELYGEYDSWCLETGTTRVDRGTFGKRIRSVLPSVRTCKPKGLDGKQRPGLRGVGLKRKEAE